MTDALASVPLRTAILAVVARNGLWLAGLVLGTWAMALWGRVGFAPVLLAGGLWVLTKGQESLADFRAADRLTSGARPREGAWAAISGRAVAAGEALEDGALLAVRFHENSVTRRRKTDGTSSTERRPRFDGAWSRPAAILTPSGETVPLMGFPDLTMTEGDAPDVSIVEAAKSHARPVPKFLPGLIARELVLSGQYPEREVALRYPRADRDDTSVETDYKTLAVGEEVTICGIWRDGALHATRLRAGGLPVVEGDAAEARRMAGGLTIGLVAVGLILVGIALALAWPRAS